MAPLSAHQSTKPLFLCNLYPLEGLLIGTLSKIYYGPFTGSPESPALDSIETIDTRRFISSKGGIARGGCGGVVGCGGVNVHF